MKFATRALWLVLIGANALLLLSSVSYLLPGLRHPFLLERMPLSFDALWRMVVKIHVACGLSCLTAGLALLARPVRARWPRLHRGLGRSYAAIVLCVMVPTGVYLAPYSKFGWLSGSGFVVSAGILAFTTVETIRAARSGADRRHRACALHSFAQVASAISFRFYHLGFQLLHLPYETNYVASVWLSVLGNLALAELAIRVAGERSHHEVFTPPERPILGVLAER